MNDEQLIPNDVIKIIAGLCLHGEYRRVCVCKAVWNQGFDCECVSDRYVSNAQSGTFLNIAATCWTLHRELYHQMQPLQLNHNFYIRRSNITFADLITSARYTDKLIDSEYAKIIMRLFNELVRKHQLEINQ